MKPPLPVPWQLGKELMGRMCIIGSRNISLCGFTADSFIWTSARCPGSGRPGEGPLGALTGSGSSLAGEVDFSLKDADEEKFVSKKPKTGEERQRGRRAAAGPRSQPSLVSLWLLSV